MKKIRVGLSFIDPGKWTGGYNYLINMIRVLLHYESKRIEPVLFAGIDIPDNELQPFAELSGLSIVRSNVFDGKRRKKGLIRAVLTGVDKDASDTFNNESIDVVLEVATYYGWSFKIPTVAWVPDFQHRILPELFGRIQYLKREIGIRMQLYTGRSLLLSSYSAKANLEDLYTIHPKDITVAPFAIETLNEVSNVNGVPIREKYRLPEKFFYLPNQYYRHKNHNVVIDAVKILRDRDINVVVASSGNSDDLRGAAYFRELRESVDDSSLDQNFRFLGLIPYKDVVVLMKEAVAVINPSRFEGWSTTVEESKSMNVSLVLSNIDVHCEQAPNACFFDPSSAQQLADALSTMLSSQESNKNKINNSTATKMDYHLDIERFACKLADMFVRCT